MGSMDPRAAIHSVWGERDSRLVGNGGTLRETKGAADKRLGAEVWARVWIWGRGVNLSRSSGLNWKGLLDEDRQGTFLRGRGKNVEIT